MGQDWYVIQEDLHKLEEWSIRNGVKCNSKNCKVSDI